MTSILTRAAALAAAATTAFAATPSASAQDLFAGYEKGDLEVTFGGTGTSDNDFDNNVISFNGSLAYFFTEGFSLGVRQDVSISDGSGDDDSSWAGATVGVANYNFNFGDFVPFVGVTLGYLYGDDVDDTFIAGPEAGLKYFVKDDAFLFGRVNYDFLFESGDEAEDNFDDGRFLYTIGIGLTF